MKNAIIDPRDPGVQITGWNTSVAPAQPISEAIPNSARVAEVASQTFPVADPLFWTPCADDVVADQWYYDTVTQNILIIPPAPPKPAAADQPVVTGAQTL